MAQPIDYAGKTAVVTGAGSGIGRALAVALARRRADLAVSDIDGEGLAETARLASQASAGASGSGRIGTYHLDVADRAAVLAHAAQVVADFGRVDLVVNNAGVAVGATIEETSFEDLDWLLGINLYGVINGTKAFLPHLIDSGDGHLVNLSSVFGLVAPAMNGAYSTAKFGVRGFTECLRQEMTVAGHPVTVHAVHPGGIRTNIVKRARVGPSLAAARPGKDPLAEFDKLLRTSPDKAASVILAGVDADKARILIGPDAYAIAGLARLLGGAYVDLLARLTRWRFRR